MTDAQVDEIKAGKEKLMQSANTLFTKMYENMQQAQQGQAGPTGQADAGASGSQGGSNDDVVDADFKEL